MIEFDNEGNRINYVPDRDPGMTNREYVSPWVLLIPVLTITVIVMYFVIWGLGSIIMWITS